MRLATYLPRYVVEVDGQALWPVLLVQISMMLALIV